MTKNSFFFNGCFDKTRIKILISWSLQNCGEQITIDLVENLKNIGFAYATQAGVSLGIDDLKIPLTKAQLISDSDTKIQTAQVHYKQGYLTGIEKFQQLIDTWHRTSEILKQNVIHYFKITNILNPVYMMAFSGARGNISQVRQLVGMRGLMSDPQGQILDFPIKSNFREGLTLTEYVISCYGARKGLVDTALKTANSGYLTRRLVDVSHHIIVCEFDCKTKRGIIVNNIIENQKIIVPLQNRLAGRILAENIYSSSETTLQVVSLLKDRSTYNLFSNTLSQLNIQTKVPVFNNSFLNSNTLYFAKIKNNARIFGLFSQLSIIYFFNQSQNWVWNQNGQNYFSTNFIKIEISKKIDFYTRLHPNNKFPLYQLLLFLRHVNLYYTKRKLIALKNQEISLNLAVKIASLKKEVLVRSPLTCEIKNSICQLCYGWSLAHGKLVSLGEAVGILAAQSIGEPGTQLTMRTFHTGGVFSGDIMSEIKAPFDGIVKFSESFQGMLIRTPHGKIAFLTKVPGKFDLYPKQNNDYSFLPGDKEFTTSTNEKVKYNKFEQSSNVFGENLTYNKVVCLEVSCSATNLSNEKSKQISFKIPPLTILFIRNHEYVTKTQIIAEFSSMSANREQRIQASYDLNTEIEGEVFFQNVVVHVRTKKQKLISRTTNNLGSIWILSGKIYKQPIPIEIFPQPGDIVNGTSIIGQYHTMSPYNGFITMKKPAILSTNKNTFLSYSQKSWKYSNSINKTSLPISLNCVQIALSNKFKQNSNVFGENLTYNKVVCLEGSCSATNLSSKVKMVLSPKSDFRKKKFKKTNLSSSKIILNHTIISLPIQSIQYKKIGYFFSFSHFKKLQLGLDYFFLANSLQQNFQNSNRLQTSFYFQSFPKQYQTETGGVLIYDNFYLNEKLYCGQIFWISHESYIFNVSNSVFLKKKYTKQTKKLNSNLSLFKNEELGLQKSTESPIKYRKNFTKWLHQTNPLILYYNSQGKISSFYSKLCGCVEINIMDSFDKFVVNQGCNEISLRVNSLQKNSLFYYQKELYSNSRLKSTPIFLNSWKLAISLNSVQICTIYKFNILGFRINPIYFIFSLFITDSRFTKKKFKISNYTLKKSKLYFYIFQCLKKNKKVNKGLLKKNRLPFLQPQFPWLNSIKSSSSNSLVITSDKFVMKQPGNEFTRKVNSLPKDSLFHDQKELCSKFLTQIKPLSDAYAISIALQHKKQFITCDKFVAKQLTSLEQSSNFLSFSNKLVGEFEQSSNEVSCFATNLSDKKKNLMKVKIKAGWIYFPKDIKQVIQKHKYILKLGGNCCDDILFDQYPIYIECCAVEKITVHHKKNIVKKNINLKNILHISDLYKKFYISRNYKSVNFYNKVIKFEQSSNEVSCFATNLPKDFLNFKKYNLFSPDKFVLKQRCSSFDYQGKFYSNFLKVLDILILNISIATFFKKNFTISSTVFNTKVQNNVCSAVYQGLILEKDIKNNKFHNFFILGKKNIYNYEKIYFLKKAPKMKHHLPLQTYVNSKNFFSFKLKNFTNKNTSDKFVVNQGCNETSLRVISVPNDSLFNYQKELCSNQSFFFQCKKRLIPKFFILINKMKSYSFISPSQYKQLLAQQNKSSIYSFSSPDKFNSTLMNFSQSLCFNKQNITHLFFNFPAADFHIKPYFKYKENKKNLFYKNITILEFCILFLIPPNYPINTIKIQLISKPVVNKLKPEIIHLFLVASNNHMNATACFLVKQRMKLNFNSISYFNVSLGRELQFSNFSSQSFTTNFSKLTRNTLLLSSQNFISNQLPVSLTKFFSPYQGEILKTHLDVTGTQNYLVLTNEDQTSFSIANVFTDKMPLLKTFLGKFIHYGTKIHPTLAIPQSGLIIQIEKTKITLRKVQPILFSSKGLLSVYNRDLIEKNALVLRLFYQRLKTGDIVQGIPKIEQLFEARKTNQGEILAGSLHEELKWLFLFYRKKYDSQQAARRSLEKIQQIIVNNVQKVYQSQGVTIAEKHLEIIVRQMTSKVQIITGGSTNLIPGELIDLDWIEVVNKGIQSKKKKAKYKPIILGITKKSLETKSFISEASFQETTRILAKSAIERKTDFLKGLKENVILGHVIPAGTGFSSKVFDSTKPKYFSIKNYESYTIFRKIFLEATPKVGA